MTMNYDENPTFALAAAIRGVCEPWSKAEIDKAGGPSSSLQVEIEAGRTEVTTATMAKYATAVKALRSRDGRPDGPWLADSLYAVQRLLEQPVPSGPALELDGARLRFTSVASAHASLEHLEVNGVRCAETPSGAHRSRWLKSVVGVADSADVIFVDRAAWAANWSDVLWRPQSQLRAGREEVSRTLAIDPLVLLRGTPVNFARRVVQILDDPSRALAANSWTPLLLAALLELPGVSLADLYDESKSSFTVDAHGFAPTDSEVSEAVRELRGLFEPLRSSIIDALSGPISDLQLAPHSTVAQFEDLLKRNPVLFDERDVRTVELIGALLPRAVAEDRPAVQSVIFGGDGLVAAVRPFFDDLRTRVGRLQILPALEAIGILTIGDGQVYAVRIA